MEETETKTELKKDWSLSAAAFRHLLEWLDGGEHLSGEGYLETRRRLVAYFDRKNCHAPDELADETLNRVARRLTEEKSLTDETPARYCYIVAKFVFLEYLRRADHHQVSIEDSLPRRQTADVVVESEEDQSHLLDCLQNCLQKLETQQRELILQYYHGERREKIDNRRALAARLGFTMNALSIKACRIRDRLEDCVRRCANAEV